MRDDQPRGEVVPFDAAQPEVAATEPVDSSAALVQMAQDGRIVLRSCEQVARTNEALIVAVLSDQVDPRKARLVGELLKNQHRFVAPSSPQAPANPAIAAGTSSPYGDRS